MVETIEIDICGQVCPSTLLTVLSEVNKRHGQLASGASCLVVYTDNRAATGTVPTAIKNMGLTADVEKTEGHYRIVIKQNGAAGELE